MLNCPKSETLTQFLALNLEHLSLLQEITLGNPNQNSSRLGYMPKHVFNESVDFCNLWSFNGYGRNSHFVMFWDIKIIQDLECGGAIWGWSVAQRQKSKTIQQKRYSKIRMVQICCIPMYLLSNFNKTCTSYSNNPNKYLVTPPNVLIFYNFSLHVNFVDRVSMILTFTNYFNYVFDYILGVLHFNSPVIIHPHPLVGTPSGGWAFVMPISFYYCICFSTKPFELSWNNLNSMSNLLYW